MRFALQITGKIVAGATKATKETHKSSIFSVNKNLKMTNIVYSTRSEFVFNCIISMSEENTHSLLILALSEEGATVYFLSLTTADINIIAALYQ